MYKINFLKLTEESVLNTIIDHERSFKKDSSIQYMSLKYLSNSVGLSKSRISRIVKKLITFGLIKVVKKHCSKGRIPRVIMVCWDKIKEALKARRETFKKLKEESSKKFHDRVTHVGAIGPIACAKPIIKKEIKVIKKVNANLIILTEKGEQWFRFFSLLSEIRGESNQRTKQIAQSVVDPAPKIKPKPKIIKKKVKLTQGGCLQGFNALTFAKQLFNKVLNSRSNIGLAPHYSDLETETLHLFPGRSQAILKAPQWERGKNLDLLKSFSIQAMQNLIKNNDEKYG